MRTALLYRPRAVAAMQSSTAAGLLLVVLLVSDFGLGLVFRNLCVSDTGVAGDLGG
jgi:hypothetical protein